jgi:hypothetical protein
MGAIFPTTEDEVKWKRDKLREYQRKSTRTIMRLEFRHDELVKDFRACKKKDALKRKALANRILFNEKSMKDSREFESGLAAFDDKLAMLERKVQQMEFYEDFSDLLEEVNTDFERIDTSDILRKMDEFETKAEMLEMNELKGDQTVQEERVEDLILRLDQEKDEEDLEAATAVVEEVHGGGAGGSGGDGVAVALSLPHPPMASSSSSSQSSSQIPPVITATSGGVIAAEEDEMSMLEKRLSLLNES